jgi:antitoxin Phd
VYGIFYVKKYKEEFTVIVNTNNIVSITEANQNFSKVARLVDESGAAVILKNNVPRYVIMEFLEVEKLQTAPDEDVNIISKRLIDKNLKAYKELAK